MRRRRSLICADMDEGDDVHGWAAVSRDLALPEQLNARVGREILRRRVDCGR